MREPRMSIEKQPMTAEDYARNEVRFVLTWDFDCTPTTCTGCTSPVCVSRTREDEKR